MAHPLGEKQNERMIKYLAESYPFKYEIIPFGDPATTLDKKYDDLSIYPYLICWNIVTLKSAIGWGGDTFNKFYDRKDGKLYPHYKKCVNYGQIAYRPFFKELANSYSK